MNDLEIRIKELGPIPACFCHNDLLSANILYDETSKQVSFIDYEYGGYNYRGFDIANHFNEWAGFECEWSHLPTERRQKEWIFEYLKAFYNHVRVDDEVEIYVSVDDVNRVYREVARFMLASHFYWGLWALVRSLSIVNVDWIWI